jgi:ABC-type Fe3+ transport system substrate-binding protein
MDHAETQIAKGAPVKWAPIPPVIANQGVEMVFKDAPHPNAAMLFMDYALGPQSEPVWKKFHYSTAGENVGFTAWSPEGDAGSVDAYTKNFTEWQSIFKEIFG